MTVQELRFRRRSRLVHHPAPRQMHPPYLFSCRSRQISLQWIQNPRHHHRWWKNPCRQNADRKNPYHRNAELHRTAPTRSRGRRRRLVRQQISRLLSDRCRRQVNEVLVTVWVLWRWVQVPLKLTSRPSLYRTRELRLLKPKVCHFLISVN